MKHRDYNEMINKPETILPEDIAQYAVFSTGIRDHDKCVQLENLINAYCNNPSELKKVVQDKLEFYKSHLGHPDYSSRIEQNACECLVREFAYLDSIAEYEVSNPQP